MSDNTNQVISSAPGQSTSLASVEKALNDLWAQLAEIDLSSPILRTATLNLILYTDDANSVPRLIDELSQSHPGRIIVIEGSKEPTGKVLATPTLFCRPSLGSAEMRKQVCCEEILLTAGPDVQDRVPGALQSLLLSDLPVYVVRQGDLAQTETMFGSLSGSIDGLIVDSATFSTPTEGLRSLVALLDKPHFTANLFDLNWQRLVPWRKALAQSFNTLPDRLTLDKIRSVEIVHNNARTQALLYIGWLLSRLEWELEPGGQPDTWTAHAAQGNVQIELRSGSGKTNGLQKVTVNTDKQLYSISVSEEGQHLVSSTNQIRAQRLPSESNGALIGAIFDQPDQDKVFEESLSVAAMLSADIELTVPRAGVVVAADGPSLARLAARYVVQAARLAVEREDRFCFVLSGGSTPKALFELLAQPPYRDQIEWSKVHVFWGDERDVPPSHPDSNQRMAREALLTHVLIPPSNIHTILTGSMSAQDAADRYAADIRSFFKLDKDQLPEFDLILLGLGDDGHTASLFPNSPALKAVDSALFVANPVTKLNTTRLTLTAGVINQAARVVFLVSGKAKADIMARVFKGPLQPDELPSQRIRPADGVLMVLTDQDAASTLRAK